MKKLITHKQLKKQADTFCALERVHDLIVLLDEPDHLFMLVLGAPQYHVFKVPKKDGTDRTIENPEPHLKRIQSKINDYLQAIYYLHRSSAAYGFMINPDDDREPRHIVSNAQRHLGKTWLLNIDLEDFFHFVKESMIRNVFQSPPFRFSEELAHALARIACLKGRLPMGAPTSPALSNFAVMQMDREIEELCADVNWVFTRYADDMSFSTDEPIRVGQIKKLDEIVQRYGYAFNPLKIKVFPPEGANITKSDYGQYAAFVHMPGTKKTVTGIQLGENGVELPEQFILKMSEEISRLRQIVTVQKHLWHEPTEWVVQYQKQIDGMLNFAEHVLGKHHGTYRALRVAYVEALEPPDPYEGVSWLDFPYL